MKKNYYIKQVLGHVRRAVEEYHMIQNGDKIAVGVSGGKDSMLLLYALHLFQKYMKIDYALVAVTVDLGYDGFDTETLRQFIEPLGIPYLVEKTEIGPIVFDVRNEKNPCALCAMLRKGAFYQAAKAQGCNKAAFGHHAEDLMETLLMSLIYESKINTFTPKTYLTRRDITLIRPFILLSEKEIIGAANSLNLPVSKNPCPIDGDTKRAEMRELLNHLMKLNPNAKKNIMAAIRNTDTYNLWDKINC